MSIVKSLQDYLSEYDGMELINLSKIRTDLAPNTPESCALAPVGNSKTMSDVLGNKYYQNMYIFFARDIVESETDRAQMYDFLEAFTSWLEDKADEDKLPKLPGSFKATNLEPSNSMLYDIEESGSGIYQIELILTIKKEKK